MDSVPDLETPNERTGYLPLHDRLVDRSRDNSTDEIERMLRLYPNAVQHVLANGRVALHLAAARSSEAIVRKILAIDASAIRKETVDGRLPLDYAIAGNANVHVIRCLLETWEESRDRIDDMGVSYLAKAISNARSSEIVREFCTEALLHHVDAQNGQTILHHAILEHKAQHVEFMLQTAPYLAAQPDTNGRLPLHTAVGIPHFPKVLLEALIQVYPKALTMPCREQHNLPLHRLVCQDGPLPQVATVRYLVEHYPDALRVRNLAGRTPLEAFHHTAGMLLYRSYDKAEAILRALIDVKLPFHDLARHDRIFPQSYRQEMFRKHLPALTRRDAKGWYAWQVAAATQTADVSLIYDLLRPSPMTLVLAGRRKGKRKMKENQRSFY